MPHIFLYIYTDFRVFTQDFPVLVISVQFSFFHTTKSRRLGTLRKEGAPKGCLLYQN